MAGESAWVPSGRAKLMARMAGRAPTGRAVLPMNRVPRRADAVLPPGMVGAGAVRDQVADRALQADRSPRCADDGNNLVEDGLAPPSAIAPQALDEMNSGVNGIQAALNAQPQ
ncbi:hypothetical protein [Nonomuraea diastatica]|uniref:Uncharacterized protein n=1 Tax=Nonomuraea diastatica TaxID=1848329 RepID=A0A4R4WIA2_9ACTN|nr:hypothetical protein [Nonomuraea diastatica]TDD18928.1 hypothetical protein E1294_22655 [Nonomuraea diastatica]